MGFPSLRCQMRWVRRLVVWAGLLAGTVYAGLPKDYVALEGISSTEGGRQYILTDYVPSSCNVRIEATVTLTKWETQGIWCSRQGMTDRTLTLFAWGTPNYFRTDRNANTGTYAKKGCPLDTKCVLVGDYAARTFTIDGEAAANKMAEGDFSPVGKLSFFASQSNGQSFGNYAVMTLHRARIYAADGSLEREYVPVRCVANAGRATEFGLYETKEGKYFSVTDATPFVPVARKEPGFCIILRGPPPPPPVVYRTVTFRRLNGTVFERISVPEGCSVTAPEGPTEAKMRFTGWDRAEKLAKVEADVDVWALYEAETDLSPSTAIASKSVAARETPYSLEEYFQLYDHLAWSDEFSGTALNRGTKRYSWSSTYTGGNWNYDMEQRNGELHKHKEDCLTVSDGCLHVACKRETNGSYQFASGGVKSNGKVAFKFGRCEIRAKLCRGLGVWPAFWMLGSTGNWPNCGEIDVLEQMNGGEWIASTLHLPHPTEQYATIETQGTCGPTDGIHWGDGFHRFGVIINAREIVFYTDDMIHKRIDIRDQRYNLLRDRAQYVIMGSGMGGAWSGVTDPSMVPAAFLREDYVVDYCRIFTNPTEGRTVSRAVSTAKPAGPVSATVWKGWEMNWGHSGAGAYQNDITTNGFTEAFYVNAALNRHVERDLPDVIVFLTEPACKTGYENGHFWTNLQLKAEGMLVGHYGQNGDKTRENLLTTVLYDGRRFSAGDSPCATLTINDASFTNYLTVAAELVERETGATVKVVGVNLNVSCSAAELQPLYDYLGSIREENAIVLVQGMSSGAYNSFKNTATSLDSAYRLLGEDAGGYRRAYATGTGAAVKPAALTIVDPARPKKVSSHTMQALQATVTF